MYFAEENFVFMVTPLYGTLAGFGKTAPFVAQDIFSDRHAAPLRQGFPQRIGGAVTKGND